MKACCNVKAMAMAMMMMMVMMVMMVVPTVTFAFVVRSPASSPAAKTTTVVPTRLSTALSASKNNNNSQKNGFFSSSSPQQQQQQPSNGTVAFASFSKLFASPSGGGGDATQAATATTSKDSLSSSLWDNTVSALWKSSPQDFSGDVATRQQQQQQQADAATSSLTVVVEEWTQPIQSALDSTMDGWVLSYADLRPDNSTTLVGASFLATNLAYLLVGMILTMQGDAVLGLLTDVTAIASFMYHYTQLEAAGQMSMQTVRLALLTDYACAAITMGTASVYLLSDSWMSGSLPVEALAAAGVSLAFLGLSWVNEKGKPYMFFHSLWHFLSAYAGYLIGTEHAAVLTTMSTGAVASTASDSVLSMDSIVATAAAIMAAAATATAAAGGAILPSAF